MRHQCGRQEDSLTITTDKLCSCQKGFRDLIWSECFRWVAVNVVHGRAARSVEDFTRDISVSEK